MNNLKQCAEMIVINTLPSLPLRQRTRLPDEPAIYFVVHNEIVFYIGKAKSLRSRWMIHHRFGQYAGKDNLRIAWIIISDTSLLSSMEKACIAHFHPIDNGTQPENIETFATIRVPHDVRRILKRIAAERDIPIYVLVRELANQLLRLDETHLENKTTSQNAVPSLTCEDAAHAEP